MLYVHEYEMVEELLMSRGFGVRCFSDNLGLH